MDFWEELFNSLGSSSDYSGLDSAMLAAGATPLADGSIDYSSLDPALLAAGATALPTGSVDYSGLDNAMLAAGATALPGTSKTPFYLQPGFLQGAGAAIGGLSQAYSGQQAAATQAAAADRAAALQETIYNSMAARNLPAESAGNLARDRYLELIGLGKNTSAAGYGSATQPFTMQGYNPNALPASFTQADLESDVIRQNALANANRISDRTLSSRGLFQSPQRAMTEMSNRLNTGQDALTRFQTNQDRQASAYNRAYNYNLQNRSNQLGPLSDLMVGGTNATNATNTAMGNYGTNVGNLMGQSAQSTAAGQLGVGNSINNLTSALSNQYNTNQMMDILDKSRRSAYSFN